MGSPQTGMNSIRIRCAVGNALLCRLSFTIEGTEREGELMADGQYAI